MYAPGPPPGTYPPGPPPHPHLPYPPLSPGASALDPPRLITSDDMRYKCKVCGRFRSPKYHHENPIPAGELPKKTVCNRCRYAGSSSDDSCDSDGRPMSCRPYRRRGRSRSRVRGRYSDEVEIRVVSEDDRPQLPRRSSSRVRVLSRGPSRSSGLEVREYYRSDSPDSDLEHVEVVETRRRRRPRSPSVEIVERVQYIDDDPRRRVVRETVQVEERVRGRRVADFEDPYYNDDYDLSRRFVWHLTK